MFKSAYKPFRQIGSDRIDLVLVVLWACLLLLAAIWLAPALFIICTSLKSTAEVLDTGAFSVPKEVFIQNYPLAWEKGHFSVTFLNSAIITFVKVPVGLAFSAMAAYALARTTLPARKVLIGIIIFGTMIPFQVMLAPLFTLVNGMGLTNTYMGAWLPYIAFGVPYQVFILYGFFKEVPQELSEAAVIDGASHFTIFWRIFLPISLPVLAALLILDFVSTWNEFAMALVLLLDGKNWTLPLSLMAFQGEFGSDYGPLNAAIVTTVAPAVIVYLIFQRYFVGGLTSGAVKG
jgi:raffinose/stachyose/melibiose transport system permease protein